jgi:hypothetical protein
MPERLNYDRRLLLWVARRRTIMRSLVSTATALVLLSAALLGQSSTPAQALHWIVPPLLPPGALIAVVSGDPTMPGRCTLQRRSWPLHHHVSALVRCSSPGFLPVQLLIEDRAGRGRRAARETL